MGLSASQRRRARRNRTPLSRVVRAEGLTHKREGDLPDPPAFQPHFDRIVAEVARRVNRHPKSNLE